jgi:glycosyltransferase involved in cell wall biosynthesis
VISVVIPVYKNSDTIAALLQSLAELTTKLDDPLEVVFVVDGSPDDSYQRLRAGLPAQPFQSQLLLLSRNFGSFAAIRAGLEAAKGDTFAVLAADLQEPPELVLEFHKRLRAGSADIVVGTRVSRADPLLSRLSSSVFWAIYRRWVQPELPPGGVDVFGCSKQVRDQILALGESNSSLVGLLFWVGFRRELVPYHRRPRPSGRSAWTLAKKLRYLTNSVFNFTDLPVRLLFWIGCLGTLGSIAGGAVVLIAKITGQVPVAGYTATVLVIVFFGALNCLGLGIIGGYVFRTLENTKHRPNYLVASRTMFGGARVDALHEASTSDR